MADWCVRHYKTFRKAPNKTIIVYFEKWSQRAGDKDVEAPVRQLLAYLSDQYDKSGEIDVEALTDEAMDHVNAVRLNRVQEDLAKTLRAGDTGAALEVASAFRKVDLRPAPSIDVFNDVEVQRAALEQAQRVLVRPRGALGGFFADELAEDSFVAFSGRPKGMKSYLLLEVAWQAALQKKRTAYFQVGDMTLNQIMRRFHARAAGRPVKSGILAWPTSLTVGQGYAAQVERDSRVYETGLSVEAGKAAFAKLAKQLGGEYLRLRSHPIKTVSILDIRNTLEEWDRADWRAEVVIIDYLENLAPTDRKLGPIDQVAETWAMTRQISEVRNCLVVSASQTNKEGFKARVQTRSNFRGSLMTLAHVTAFVGINQTEEEKDVQVARLNFMVGRNTEWSETKCCVVAGSLGISRPAMLSWFEI